MKNINKKCSLAGLISSALILGFSANAFAISVHTWHKVTAADDSWAGRLVIASANEDAYFTDASGNKKGEIYDFNVSPTTPFTYGFGFNILKTGFNVSYTLTLYKTGIFSAMDAPAFISKACVFNVSAKGPADPDIRVQQFNGAKCSYNVVPGTGENFSVK